MAHKGKYERGNTSIKNPSLKGASHTNYLGHFAQEKFLAQGHNNVEKCYEGEDPAACRARLERARRESAGGAQAKGIAKAIAEGNPEARRNIAKAFGGK